MKRTVWIMGACVAATLAAGHSSAVGQAVMPDVVLHPRVPATQITEVVPLSGVAAVPGGPLACSECGVAGCGGCAAGPVAADSGCTGCAAGCDECGCGCNAGCSIGCGGSCDGCAAGCGGGCDSCCDTGCGSCCDAPYTTVCGDGNGCSVQAGGWYAGFDVSFTKPQLKESFQAIEIDLLTGTQNLLGFSYDYDPAYRAWVGFEGPEGVGIRGRYWQYDHGGNTLTLVSDPFTIVGAQSITVIFPGVITSDDPGEVLTADSDFNVQTFDLEMTQRVELGRISGRVGAGLRYARMDQTNSAVISDGFIVEQILTTQRVFEGIGPMLSGEFRRPFGCHGLAGVVGARGGVLFGEKSLSRFEANGSSGLPPFISLSSVDEVSGVGEVDIGLEWRRETRHGALAVRTAYEGQLWTDAGAPTLTFLGFEGFRIGVELTR